MKAIKIDVEQKRLYEVDLETINNSQLKSIYQHLGCGCFCQALRYPTNDILFVDDNGLFRKLEQINGVFQINGQMQPLIGHGLIVGHSRNGEACDVKIKIDQIVKGIQWLAVEDVVDYLIK